MKWIKNDKTFRGISGIYAISNIVNGKVYIGSSFDIGKRLDQHLLNLEFRGGCENHGLYQDFLKYGQSSFEVSILEEVPDNKSSEREKYWIDNTSNVYNGSIFYGKRLKGK